MRYRLSGTQRRGQGGRGQVTARLSAPTSPRVPWAPAVWGGGGHAVWEMSRCGKVRGVLAADARRVRVNTEARWAEKGHSFRQIRVGLRVTGHMLERLSFRDHRGFRRTRSLILETGHVAEIKISSKTRLIRQKEVLPNVAIADDFMRIYLFYFGSASVPGAMT